MPLPAPGPPRTKSTVTSEGEKVGISFLGPLIWGVVGAMSVLDVLSVSTEEFWNDDVEMKESWKLKAALELKVCTFSGDS